VPEVPLEPASPVSPVNLTAQLQHSPMPLKLVGSNVN
jgi:hypothetical protein